MRNLRAHAVALSLATTFLALVACSSSDDEVCNGQTQCVCNEGCSKSCGSESSGDCQFVCRAGTCSFDCAGGSCRVSCEGSSSCTVSCPKGGCTVSGGTRKTDVTCGGLGTCTVSCTGSSDDCRVDGQPGAASGGGAPNLPGASSGLPGTGDTDGF